MLEDKQLMREALDAANELLMSTAGRGQASVFIISSDAMNHQQKHITEKSEHHTVYCCF